MTVFFAIKGAHSNSHEEKDGEPVKVPLKDVAHEINCMPKAYILKPKIDKISVTFDVPGAEPRKKIVEWLKAKKADTAAPEYEGIKKSDTLPGGYRVSVHLREPSSGLPILIQAGPVKGSKTQKFMRFEWNPDRLGLSGMAFLRKRLSDVLQGEYSYADVGQAGTVTRVDIAFDLVNLTVDDILVATSIPKKTKLFLGPEGAVESAYFGVDAKNKAGFATVYDKKKQLLGTAGTIFGHIAHTRIEVRRRAVNKPIVDLPSLKNPLTSLSLYFPTAVAAPEQQHHWRFFLDSCRWRGFPSALSIIPEPLRPSYQNALDKATKLHWDTAKLWTHWPEAVKGSGLLDF